MKEGYRQAGRVHSAGGERRRGGKGGLGRWGLGRLYWVVGGAARATKVDLPGGQHPWKGECIRLWQTAGGPCRMFLA